jgi:hypothetical protein
MHVATRATTAMAPITMPAIAPPDRDVLCGGPPAGPPAREVEAEPEVEVAAEAEVEAKVEAEAGADLDVVVEEVELRAADGDDVARDVAGNCVCE